MPLGGGDELIDVLDEDGRVVGRASRSRMRAEQLPHRATYVALVRAVQKPASGPGGTGRLHSDDLVVVHQRALWKDVYPGYWDIAFGGVCSAGEDWYESAKRELKEEAGVEAELSLLADGQYQDADNHSFGRIFLARSQADVACLDGEVVAVDEVPLGEIAGWVNGRPVCPDSLQLVLPALLDLMD